MDVRVRTKRSAWKQNERLPQGSSTEVQDTVEKAEVLQCLVGWNSKLSGHGESGAQARFLHCAPSGKAPVFLRAAHALGPFSGRRHSMSSVHFLLKREVFPFFSSLFRFCQQTAIFLRPASAGTHSHSFSCCAQGVTHSFPRPFSLFTITT